MRYVSVVVLSLVMLVIGVSAADAVNYAQQPTAANPNNSIANKKDLCRPGMVFIPSTGTCGCPKAQYQYMNLSSGSTTVGDCRTLENILKNRQEEETGVVNNEGCTSSDSAKSFAFSSTSQRVHDVVATRDGFIAAGLSRGSGMWSVLKYNSDGTQYERLMVMDPSHTTFTDLSSIKLAPLLNGGVMILINAKGPSGKYHLYANIIDANGTMLFQNTWRPIPLNMDIETVFDVINIGGKFMISYAAPKHPNGTGGTQKALVGFVLNRHLAMYKEPRVLATREELFKETAPTNGGFEPFSVSFEHAGYNRVLLNYVPQSAPVDSHIYGYIIDYDMDILSSIGDIGGEPERIENGGLFVLSDDKILAASSLKTVGGEIIIRNFDLNLGSVVIF